MADWELVGRAETQRERERELYYADGWGKSRVLIKATTLPVHESRGRPQIQDRQGSSQ